MKVLGVLHAFVGVPLRADIWRTSVRGLYVCERSRRRSDARSPFSAQLYDDSKGEEPVEVRSEVCGRERRGVWDRAWVLACCVLL